MKALVDGKGLLPRYMFNGDESVQVLRFIHVSWQSGQQRRPRPENQGEDEPAFMRRDREVRKDQRDRP